MARWGAIAGDSSASRRCWRGNWPARSGTLLVVVLRLLALRQDRAEHRLLHLGEGLDVLAREVGHGCERRVRDDLGDLRLHGFLLVQERLDALLQEPRQEALHRVAVEADDRL